MSYCVYKYIKYIHAPSLVAQLKFRNSSPVTRETLTFGNRHTYFLVCIPKTLNPRPLNPKPLNPQHAEAIVCPLLPARPPHEGFMGLDLMFFAFFRRFYAFVFLGAFMFFFVTRFYVFCFFRRFYSPPIRG